MTAQPKKALVFVVDVNAGSARQTGQLLSEARDCEVVTYNNVRDALINIPQGQPDLVVTEWELKGLGGDELIVALKAHQELQKIPILVVTANQAPDLRKKAKSIGAYDLLTKPLDRKRIKQLLDKILPANHFTPGTAEPEESDRVREQILRIDKLAPLPAMVKTVLDITNDPNSSARQLSEVIKRDQVMTGKILQIVNSAYYGFYREIGNIDHAVVILGFNEVVNITLAACIIHTYRDGDSPLFNRTQFWIHTLGAAFIARSLRRYLPEVISKDAFVIGLLHDLGKVVLDQHFKELFHEIVKDAADKGIPLHVAEQNRLQLDHALVGGLIAESWNLPQTLVDSIKHHHNPGAVGKQDYTVHLAHLANCFAHRQGIGASGNPAPEAPHPSTLEVFGLEDKDLDEVWESLNIDAKALKTIL